MFSNGFKGVLRTELAQILGEIWGFAWVDLTCFLYIKIIPLQKDPKQQELNTHLRPRLNLGPYEGQSHWFYRLGPFSV